MIKACIFDLDGVIVDTAKHHYRAWRRLANQLGFDFSETANEQLKGVGRMQSLELILEMGNISLDGEKKLALANQKNKWYREYIQDISPKDILPGVLDFFAALQQRGLRIALGSASKNAPTILHLLNIDHYFEVAIDGTKFTKAKPDPEIFLKGVNGLGIQPSECIVFEDAYKGVEAALRGGMYAVGVGSPDVLTNAHFVIQTFEGLSFEKLTEELGILS